MLQHIPWVVRLGISALLLGDCFFDGPGGGVTVPPSAKDDEPYIRALMDSNGLKLVIDSALTETHWSKSGDSIVSQAQSKLHVRLKEGRYLCTLVMVADKNNLPVDAVTKIYEGSITHEQKKVGMMELWTPGAVKIKDAQGRPL